jgi:gamma-glutamyl phosphate reductase
MNYLSKERLQSAVVELASRARVASRALAKLSNQSRNELLMTVAKAIEDGGRKILEANERDCYAAEPAVSVGTMSSAPRC